MIKNRMPAKVEPFNHQKEAFNFTMNNFQEGHSGTALLMDMGCGKTLTAVAIAGALYNAQKIKKVLIVCPLSIVGVWQEEFEKFADFDYKLSILKGSMAKKSELLQKMQGPGLQVAVVNYESVWRLEKGISDWKPDFIVADESHKIKTHNIAASKAMHRLGSKSTFRLILTGTVITNREIDVFSQYKFVEPSVFGNSFYAFRNKYFDMVGYGQHTPVLKESMKDELMAKVHSIAFRATKTECLDLPAITEIIRYVELDPSTIKIYKSLVKDSFAQLNKGDITTTNVLTKLLRLSQLTGGFIRSDEGNTYQQLGKAKMTALEDIIENAAQSGEKLVVIARFVPEITAIQKMLNKKHILYSTVSGEIKDREAQIHKFQNDSKVTVFIGQVATAGLGITLTAASTMVFYSLDYSMSNFEQAKARIHRAGQQKNCTYIYLIAKDTVDEKVLITLQNKANLVKELIDEYKCGLNPYEIGGI